MSAAALAVGESLDAAFSTPELFGLLYAVSVWVGTFWAYRSRGWGAPAFLGALATIEFLMVGTISGHDEDPAPSWKLTTFAALTMLVMLTSLATILRIARERRRVDEDEDDMPDAA